MTFADKLKDALLKARARTTDESLTDEEWKRVVNETAAAHFKRRKPVTVLDQEKCREALARACGIIAIGQMTEAGWKPIRKALADIRRVFDGNDEALIAEINRRALAYRTKHPTWTLTASALAKYWANFGRLANEVDTAPPEPAGWLAWMWSNREGWVRFSDADREGIPVPPWARLRRDEQGFISEEMRKEGAL